MEYLFCFLILLLLIKYLCQPIFALKYIKVILANRCLIFLYRLIKHLFYFLILLLLVKCLCQPIFAIKRAKVILANYYLIYRLIEYIFCFLILILLIKRLYQLIFTIKNTRVILVNRYLMSLHHLTEYRAIHVYLCLYSYCYTLVVYKGIEFKLKPSQIQKQG